MGLLGSIGDAINGNRKYIKSKRLQDRQWAQDEKMAKHSIQWRVQDAKQAGLHPLYALGGPSFQASATNTTAPDSGLGSLGRGIESYLNKDYERELQAKNLENIQADIDLKKAQTADTISQAKMASNIARQTQTGRTAGNTNKVTAFGEDIHASSNWSDTQKVEDRYGDMISWIYGFGPLINDTWSDFQKSMARSRKNAYKPKHRRNKQPGRRW